MKPLPYTRTFEGSQSKTLEIPVIMKNPKVGIESLPLELLLHVISLLHPIDLYALKLAGSRGILEAVRCVCRNVPFHEYLDAMRLEMGRRWEQVHQWPLTLAAARGHLALITALLDRAARGYGILGISKAVPSQRRSVFKRLFQQRPTGGGLLDRDPSGKNPLHWAAEYGQDEVIRLLVKHGANPLAPTGFGFTTGTAIHLAAANGHLSTVVLLLRMGAAVNSHGLDLLECAARFGRHHIVQYLLERRTLLGTVECRTTALRSAAQYGHLSTVTLLLDKRHANHPLVRDDPCGQYFVTCVAALNGHEAIVRKLLDHGHWDEPKRLRGLAVGRALSGGHTSIVRLLMRRSRPRGIAGTQTQSLTTYVERGDLPAIERLGGDLQDIGEALHAAATTGYVTIIEYLLKAGGDVEEEGHGKWRALHWAASYHRFEAVSYLLKIGARPDPRDTDFLTPLHCACFEPSSKFETDRAKATVELLIAHCPAMIHARDSYGRLPLHIAAASGFAEAIITLLAHDRQTIEVRDHMGKSPLMTAAQNLKEIAVRTLLSAGCEVNARDISRQTAAHLAARPGGRSVYRLLESRGADLSVKDTNRRTPRDNWDLSRHCERDFRAEYHGRLYYPFFFPVDLKTFSVE